MLGGLAVLPLGAVLLGLGLRRELQDLVDELHRLLVLCSGWCCAQPCLELHHPGHELALLGVRVGVLAAEEAPGTARAVPEDPLTAQHLCVCVKGQEGRDHGGEHVKPKEPQGKVREALGDRGEREHGAQGEAADHHEEAP